MTTQPDKFNPIADHPYISIIYTRSGYHLDFILGRDIDDHVNMHRALHADLTFLFIESDNIDLHKKIILRNMRGRYTSAKLYEAKTYGKLAKLAVSITNSPINMISFGKCNAPPTSNGGINYVHLNNSHIFLGNDSPEIYSFRLPLQSRANLLAKSTRIFDAFIQSCNNK